MSKPDILRYLTAQYIGTNATTGDIQNALYGQPKETDKPQREEVVYDLSRQDGPTPDLRSLAQGGSNRRTQRFHKPRGERSPQNHGRR